MPNNYSSLGTYSIVPDAASLPSATVGGRLAYQEDQQGLLVSDGSVWRGVRMREYVASDTGLIFPGTTSGGTLSTIASLTMPAQPCAGQVIVFAYVAFTVTVPGDTWLMNLVVGGSNLNGVSALGTETSTYRSYPLQADTSVAANTSLATSLTLQRTSGSGTGTVPFVPPGASLTILFVPTA